MRDPASRGTAEDAERQAFDQALTEQSPAAGTECGTHRQFALTAGRASEEERGDVGARHQKNRKDRTQQHPGSESRIAYLSIAKRNHGEVNFFAKWRRRSLQRTVEKRLKANDRFRDG